MSLRRIVPVVLLIGALVPAPAAQPTTLLPRDSLVVAEAADLADTLGDLMDSELWDRFQSGRLGREAVTVPEVGSALAALAGLAGAARAAPEELLDALTGGGAAFALVPAEDQQEPHAVLVCHADDARKAQDGLNGLLGLVSGGEARVEGTSWRLPLGDALAERRDDVFLLSNAPAALDRLPSSPRDSVARDPHFVAARRALEDADAWVWVRGAAFQTEPGIDEKLPEVGGSLLGGAVNEVLRRASWAAAGLSVRDDGLAVRMLAPADGEALTESHAPFFPEASEVEAPVFPGRLGVGVLHRDLGPWWTGRDLYVTERGVADSVEADGNLSLIFQRDIGPEVFHWLAPELLLVAGRVAFPGGRPEPELPAGAMGVALRDGHPDDLPQAFVNAFFSTVTFINFETDGTRDTLQPDMELLPGGGRLYLTKRRPSDEEPRPVSHNATPALLLATDGRVWLSSSTELLRVIAEAPTETLAVRGDRVELAAEPSRAILAADREVIVAQRTLVEGGDVDAAETFFEQLLAGTELVERVSLASGLRGSLFELSLEALTR